MADGTVRILEILRRMPVSPERVWIDHAEEHTIRPIRDAGYWLGFPLYPITKCSPKRAVDMLETYGTEENIGRDPLRYLGCFVGS